MNTQEISKVGKSPEAIKQESFLVVLGDALSQISLARETVSTFVHNGKQFGIGDMKTEHMLSAAVRISGQIPRSVAEKIHSVMINPDARYDLRN